MQHFEASPNSYQVVFHAYMAGIYHFVAVSGGSGDSFVIIEDGHTTQRTLAAQRQDLASSQYHMTVLLAPGDELFWKGSSPIDLYGYRTADEI